MAMPKALWLVAKPLALLLLPVFVFFLGAKLMAEISQRKAPGGLRWRAAVETPLNQRLLGYDRADVEAHWNQLGQKGQLAAETLFLELDLLFPLLYGGALLASLLLARAWLGWTISPAWLVAPVAVVILADWTENLVHLDQLGRMVQAGSVPGAAALGGFSIALASVATIVKLWVFAGTFAGVLVLAVRVWLHERS